MENIAVNRVNITDASVFAITASGEGGVIMDSGTTLAYLVEPAYTEFINAVSTFFPSRWGVEFCFGALWVMFSDCFVSVMTDRIWSSG
jgi:hypothetical protein